MGKLAISEMVLFDKSSNKRRATRGVANVFKWWVSTNLESTKQWVDPELMRARNRILLRWSWPKIKEEVRETESEWGSERADALSRIGLVVAQRSSMRPSVCVESWGCSLFFREFLRSSCWSTVAFGWDRDLLLRTGVQLVVSCTAIEVQICYDPKLKVLSNKTTLVLSNTRELNRDPFTK